MFFIILLFQLLFQEVLTVIHIILSNPCFYKGFSVPKSTAKFEKKLDYLDYLDILDILDFTKPLIFQACPVSPVCPDSPVCHGSLGENPSFTSLLIQIVISSYP